MSSVKQNDEEWPTKNNSNDANSSLLLATKKLASNLSTSTIDSNSSLVHPPMIPRPEYLNSNINVYVNNNSSGNQIQGLLQYHFYPPPPITSSHSTHLSFTQGFLPAPLPPISEQKVNSQLPPSHNLVTQTQTHLTDIDNNKAKDLVQISTHPTSRSLSPLCVGSHQYHETQQYSQQFHTQLQQYHQAQDLHHPQHQFLLQDQTKRWKKRKIDNQIPHSPNLLEVSSKRTTQENILKLVALKNKDKPLSEYASIVRSAEIEVLNMDSSTHSKLESQAAEQHRERERQIYALIWLMNNCLPDNDSYVPRGRIFSQYAASCASNNLKPLSQATLGKLIRSLFPDLKTRRLGMRGQSKYHYCGLKFISSMTVPDETNLNTSKSGTFQSSVKEFATQSFLSSGSSKNGYSLVKNSDIDATSEVSRDISESFTKNNTKVFFQNDDLCIIDRFFAKTCDEKVELPLSFPLINPFLPSNIDSDIASSVESLYKMYCNQLFENIRFMKFDDLPNTLESFSSGSISSQMYNLFISEELYCWVETCDLITHKALAKMLSSLIVEFDEIPGIVLDKLSQFSTSYLDLVSKATIDLPTTIVLNKKRIASQFIRLVKRLINVIDTGKHASDQLSSHETRLAMCRDWNKFINIKELISTEFAHFHDKTIIDQLNDFVENEMLSMLLKKSSEHELHEGINEGTMLVKFAKKLCDLLQSWKHLPARLVILNMISLTTTALRNLSLSNSEMFGPWWILKAFVDEWLFWCGEVGGFLNE